MADDVISKDVDYRSVKPLTAEVDARRLASELMDRRASIDRVLEQRDPRLMPKSIVQQQRRVHRRGKYGCGEGLRPVEDVRKFFGSDLEMYLETCVAKLDERVLQYHLQFVEAFDVDETIVAVKLRDDTIDLEVARVGRQVFLRQVGGFDCRQDAGEDDVGSE